MPILTVQQLRERRGEGAFTLIELMAVMAIILILAGLILSLAGNANAKASTARAQGEIQSMAAACEMYKADNGVYPRITTAANSSNNTDGLDPRVSTDPGASITPSYSNASLILYKLLSGGFYLDSTGNVQQWKSTITPLPAKPTVYLAFNDNQLKNSGGLTSGFITPTTVQAIVDPFGLSYGYSTAYQADVDTNAANGTNVTPTHGYNPTFDLWSTAGYGTGGKVYPSSVASTSYSTLWVKNW